MIIKKKEKLYLRVWLIVLILCFMILSKKNILIDAVISDYKKKVKLTPDVFF